MSNQILTFSKLSVTMESETGTSTPLPGAEPVSAGVLSADDLANMLAGRDDGSFSWFETRKDGATPTEHTGLSVHAAPPADGAPSTPTYVTLTLPLEPQSLVSREPYTGAPKTGSDLTDSDLYGSKTDLTAMSSTKAAEAHGASTPSVDAAPPTDGAPTHVTLTLPSEPQSLVSRDPYTGAPKTGSDLTGFDPSSSKVDLTAMSTAKADEAHGASTPSVHAAPPADGAPSTPTYVTLTLPLEPQSLVSRDPYTGAPKTGSDLTDFDPSTSKAVAEHNTDNASDTSPAQQIYGVGAEAGNVYVIWDNQGHNNEFVALAYLEQSSSDSFTLKAIGSFFDSFNVL